MPFYLIEVGYTSEAWKTQVNKPQDRSKALAPVIKKAGGKLIGFWYTFGDRDAILIVEMPNNVGAAALSLATAAGGAVRSFKTTPLLTVKEGIAAMRKAQTSGYTPPKK